MHEAGYSNAAEMLAVQPLQQIGNLHLLRQWHDPLLIQGSNSCWLHFEGHGL